jgi:uncharacterized membrane protein YidH (DUF202 family)
MKTTAAARHAKDILISMHVISSVGWGIMATAQFAMLMRIVSMDPGDNLPSLEVALFLENNLLDPFAIIAVYTGMMLSALTPFGYFRHWWVVVKFVLSWAALLSAAIFISNWLPEAIEASTAGREASLTKLFIGTVSMVVAIAAMAWISLVKPWGRRGDSRKRRIDLNPSVWTFVAVALIPVVEWAARVDYPLMTLLTIIGYSIFRGRRLRKLQRAAVAKAKPQEPAAPAPASSVR